MNSKKSLRAKSSCGNSNSNLFFSDSRSFDLSSSKVSSSSFSIKANEALSNSKPTTLGMEYEEDIPKRGPSLKPEGNLIIRSPSAPPFTIPYNQWESLEMIKKRIGEHLMYDLEPFHYVTKHGSIQPNTLLKDYQVQNNFVILMIPKDQFEKERIQRRNMWINMKKKKASNFKPIIVSPVQKVIKGKTKKPFYL